MAQHNFKSDNYSLDAKLVTLHARVNIGATGAPTLQALNRNASPPAWQAAGANGYNGIKSITRSSAGVYVVTLVYPYVGLLAFWGGFQSDAGVAGGSVLANATGTNVTSRTAPQITFTCYNNAQAATELPSGSVLLLEIELTDSIAP